MKKFLLVGVLCITVLTSMIAVKGKEAAKAGSITNKITTVNKSVTNEVLINYWVDSLYSQMQLAAIGLSRPVFFEAYKGYEYLLSVNKIKKQGFLTICDYSQASNKRRLYVLDIDKAKVLFNTYVSHGRNSGSAFATSFSNSNDSHKTSLGFMSTAETYNGDNGYSLRLDGLESGFNDNVRARAIVMHGSNYVNGRRASDGTMMGRSYGCPAVPAKEVKGIINAIKGGSCFFSYYPDKMYAAASKILNADFIWPLTQTPQLASLKLPDSLVKNLSQPDAFNLN
ncbi:murein L,D-transpeptidase catalytic domain family protein [Parafilimonas sp.]|uniref:murein L,D-transpeptidase catalytic domain family protein n=1 Tax=Parafilimonas sp. TaxID=1969739 RepID=UPI0039E5EA6B